MSSTNIFGDRKVAFYTLGCKLNFTETSAIGKELLSRGFTTALPNEYANVCIINTCSVTDLADKKCRYTIQKAQREHPNSYLIVTGCYAQLKPEEVAELKGVDLVLGSNEKEQLPEYIAQIEQGIETPSVRTSRFKDITHFKPSWSFGNRTRCFLKVQDGCDYFCTYCTIPMARGKSRSSSIQKTVAEARDAAKAGAKEIVLTGVNIGEFGKGSSEDFFQLVQTLDQVEEIERVRISSIEPNLLTDEIIEYVSKSQRIMPHFHIPLQSGCNSMLELMERKYTCELFTHKIDLIRKLIPHAFIGVDVIVGMRGEEAHFFEETRQFIEGLSLSQLHVFTYSERAGTKALKIDHVVTLSDKKLRSEQLHALSDVKTQHFYQEFVGQVRPVLVESQRKGNVMYGFTDNYIKVELPYDASRINQVVSVQLNTFNADNSALLGSF